MEEIVDVQNTFFHHGFKNLLFGFEVMIKTAFGKTGNIQNILNTGLFVAFFNK